MFDFGWTELVLIGVVALIVIGPEDLPEMFRQIGRFTAKLRAMSRDLQRAMDQAAKEAGVKDVAKDLKTMTSPTSLGLNAVKDAADKFEKWDPLKKTTPKASVAAPAKAAAATDPADPVTTIHGPATEALYQKHAAKRTAPKDGAATPPPAPKAAKKRKSAPAATAEPLAKPLKSAPSRRAKTAQPGSTTEPLAITAPKPRAPRKTTKKADEA